MAYSWNVSVKASPPVVGMGLTLLIHWGSRRWMIAVGAALGAAALVGIPTGLISTPYYTRMTVALWWNYPVWIVSSLLAGITLATYYRPRGSVLSRSRGLTTGGLLTAFAVGCPSCNGLVVAALGTSGALSIWAPVQPYVAVLAIGLVAYAAARRLRAEQSCLLSKAADRPIVVTPLGSGGLT